MQFYEKLIFLQNLTQVTNRMLAHEIQVDPSQISRLRTGARGIPRNRDLIKAMSSYFAKRCNTEYQRQALSGMLGIKQALTLKKDQLSEILYYWLCGESAEVGRFIRTFESLTFGDPDAGIPEDPFRLNIDKSLVVSAYRRVKTSAGAAGIDKQSLADFDKDAVVASCVIGFSDFIEAFQLCQRGRIVFGAL